MHINGINIWTAAVLTYKTSGCYLMTVDVDNFSTNKVNIQIYTSSATFDVFIWEKLSLPCSYVRQVQELEQCFRKLLH